MTNAKWDKLYDDLRKEFGDDTIKRAVDIPKRPGIPSGSLALDFAVGFHGMPQDRAIEISGKESSGKTTLAIMIMCKFLDAQPERGALFLDLEHKLTSDWLEYLVGEERMKRIMYIQPDHAEMATNIYKRALPTGQACFALYDSIAGAPTMRRNDDAEVGGYGGNAIAISEFARHAALNSAKYACLTVGINQTRDDFGGYNRLITPGGRAWKAACILRLELRKSTREIDYLSSGGEKIPIGHMIYCKVVKNQLGGVEGRTCNWWFYSVETPEHPFGIDSLDEIVRLGVVTEVLQRNGGWYTHPALPANAKGEHKVQGIDAIKALVRTDESLRMTLTSEILAGLDAHSDEVAPISEPDASVEPKLAPFPDNPKDMSPAQLDHAAKGLIENFQKDG